MFPLLVLVIRDGYRTAAFSLAIRDRRSHCGRAGPLAAFIILGGSAGV